jgi:branched-chain amino acid transport system substrate-binding protein
MLRQSDALGLKPEIFVGYGETFTKPNFQRTAGEVAELIYFSTLWFPTLPYKESRNFYRGFLNKFEIRPNYHAAQAHACMWVIADALMRSTSFSRKDVRDALVETSMMTALGPVQFQSYGRKTQQNILPAYVVRWIDDRLTLVSPRRLKKLN